MTTSEAKGCEIEVSPQSRIRIRSHAFIHACGGFPDAPIGCPASASKSQARSSSWPSNSATRSGHRSKRRADSRGSKACTGEHALALLYERRYAELVRLAFALTSDWGLAEELAQEAFVRVWRSWGNIRDQQSAPAYLRTTVVNLARRSLRRRLQERRAWHDAGIE